jgi:imidazole glycerol-phosphate synthase subunit HisH
MIVIIDYGMGNLASILNMLKKIGVEGAISGDIKSIETAGKLILPGVGAFDNGISQLEERGLISILRKKVIVEKIPILGICLGMQLMTNQSEEGVLSGLGWIDAVTVRFKFGKAQSNLKIPHMGWNTVQVFKEPSLFDGIMPEPRFYFVHSYHAVCKDNDVLTRSFHGYEFTSAFKRDNVTGVQFHPEKSHKFGMTFLKNWADS